MVATTTQLTLPNHSPQLHGGKQGMEEIVRPTIFWQRRRFLYAGDLDIGVFVRIAVMDRMNRRKRVEVRSVILWFRSLFLLARVPSADSSPCLLFTSTASVAPWRLSYLSGSTSKSAGFQYCVWPSVSLARYLVESGLIKHRMSKRCTINRPVLLTRGPWPAISLLCQTQQELCRATTNIDHLNQESYLSNVVT